MNQLTQADAIAIEAEICRRSLHEFVRMAWKVLEPANKFVDNWHVGLLCEYLESVSRGEINRLLINVPPGAMKSMLVSVFWPAWEWIERPELRVLSASHSGDLSMRDNLKMRRLVTSEWYQLLFRVKLTGDQNQKSYFENDKTGFRQAAPFRSLTGKRGDRVILDDPHSVEGAISDAERTETIRVFKETLTTRLNSPKESAIVVIMQRLHEQDVSGVILDEELGYTHVMLPMEFDVKRKSKGDPRTEEGELLFPERFTKDVVDRDKKAMGAYASSGQFQQSPAPRGGGFFEWEKFRVINEVPRFITKKVRYWDKAGSKDTGCYTVGVLMGVTRDKDYIVLDVVRGQWSFAKREQTIKQTSDIDGRAVVVWIEQEPGSGGMESAERTIKNLAGCIVRADKVGTGKELRASSYSVQVENSSVMVLNKGWTQSFIDEHKTFPVGKYKDQVDAASGAFSQVSKGIDYSQLL